MKEKIDGVRVVRKYVDDENFNENVNVPSAANNNSVVAYVHKGDIVEGRPGILWVLKKPHVMIRCWRMERSNVFEVTKSVSRILLRLM